MKKATDIVIELVDSVLTPTSGDVDEVLARCLVDLDVAGADVVLVPPERHVAVGGRLEQHQRLAVPPPLRRQAERHPCSSTGYNLGL